MPVPIFVDKQNCFVSVLFQGCFHEGRQRGIKETSSIDPQTLPSRCCYSRDVSMNEGGGVSSTQLRLIADSVVFFTLFLDNVRERRQRGPQAPSSADQTTVSSCFCCSRIAYTNKDRGAYRHPLLLIHRVYNVVLAAPGVCPRTNAKEHPCTQLSFSTECVIRSCCFRHVSTKEDVGASENPAPLSNRLCHLEGFSRKVPTNEGRGASRNPAPVIYRLCHRVLVLPGM